MTTVEAMAPAKLNLGLEILGRREDGYHEIRTILQSVSIYDRLRLEPATEMRLSCSTPDLATDTNLTLRAVELVRSTFGIPSGASIVLDKGIPTAAGLGGASSDAAAALRAAAALSSLNPAEDELTTLALQLGSDVPYFLRGGTMLAEGRGESLTALPPLAGLWFVVASPRVEMPNKTATMYRSLIREDFSNGSAVDALARAVEQGKPIDWDLMVNGFDRAARRLVPDLDELCHAFGQAEAPFVAMTGAGPSLYTATADRGLAAAIRTRLERRLRSSVALFLCEPLAVVPPVVSV